MLNFYCIGGPYGDCTARYVIKPNADIYTVKQLVDDVLKRDEWGRIRIYTPNNPLEGPSCEYHENRLTTRPFSEECLSRKIKKIRGSGGYGRMDYTVTLEETV